MEHPYSKREQDTYMKTISDHLAKQDVTLGRIEDQTTKTNGRVSGLEFWKPIILWALGGIYAVIAVAYVVTWHFLKIEIQNTSSEASKAAVISALSQYNIVVK